MTTCQCPDQELIKTVNNDLDLQIIHRQSASDFFQTWICLFWYSARNIWVAESPNLRVHTSLRMTGYDLIALHNFYSTSKFYFFILQTNHKYRVSIASSMKRLNSIRQILVRENSNSDDNSSTKMEIWKHLLVISSYTWLEKPFSAVGRKKGRGMVCEVGGSICVTLDGE